MNILPDQIGEETITNRHFYFLHFLNTRFIISVIIKLTEAPIAAKMEVCMISAHWILDRMTSSVPHTVPVLVPEMKD